MIKKSVLLCVTIAIGLVCGSQINKQQEINLPVENCHSTNSYLTGCSENVVEEATVEEIGGNGQKDPSSGWVENVENCHSSNSYLTGCNDNVVEELDTEPLSKAGGKQDFTIYM